MVQMSTAGGGALHAFPFPPAAERARHRPNYYLLGFSAALPPKFPFSVLGARAILHKGGEKGHGVKVGGFKGTAEGFKSDVESSRGKAKNFN